MENGLKNKRKKNMGIAISVFAGEGQGIGKEVKLADLPTQEHKLRGE